MDFAFLGSLQDREPLLFKKKKKKAQEKGILHIMGPLNGCSFPGHQIAYLGLAANPVHQL